MSNNLDEIRAQVEARRQAEAEKLKSQNDSDELSLKFIANCLHCNEVGDGILYSTVNCDSFIYEPSGGVWFYWNGVCFERDVEGRAAGAMEKVVECYIKYWSNLTQKRGKDNA